MNAPGDDIQVARWGRELEDADLRTRSRAAVILAAIVRDRGDADAAERLLHRALNGRDRTYRPRAAFALGQLLADTGRAREAELALLLAARASDPTLTPDVHMNVAAQLAARGNRDRAVALYEEVIAAVGAHTDPKVAAEAAVAAFRLGELRREAGDVDGAKHAFREALFGGDPEAAVRSALALCELMAKDEGDGAEMIALLEGLIALDHPDGSPAAAVRLADVRAAEGNTAEAYRLLELVIQSEHPEWVAEAEERVSALLRRQVDRLIERALGRRRPPRVELDPAQALSWRGDRPLGSLQPPRFAISVLFAHRRLTTVIYVESLGPRRSREAPFAAVGVGDAIQALTASAQGRLQVPPLLYLIRSMSRPTNDRLPEPPERSPEIPDSRSPDESPWRALSLCLLDAPGNADALPGRYTLCISEACVLLATMSGHLAGTIEPERLHRSATGQPEAHYVPVICEIEHQRDDIPSEEHAEPDLGSVESNRIQRD